MASVAGAAPLNDWIAESHIQVGDPYAAPWSHMAALLNGLVAGLVARGADDPKAMPNSADGLPSNPTRHLCFGLRAPDEDAAQAAADALFHAALETAVVGLPKHARAFGWMASTDVRPV
jgi:hypothetical protein